MHTQLITDNIRLIKALFLNTLGWVFILSASSVLSYIFFGLFALIFWIMGAYNLAKGLYTQPYQKFINIVRWVLVWLPIILLPFFSSYMYILSASFIFAVLSNISLKQTLKIPRANTITRTSKPKKSPQTVKQKQHQKITLNSHASHLANLLSRDTLNVLLDIIEAINKLQSQSDFLEQNHPYLASSVSELIHDLTQNTIIRLDNVAKNFVSSTNLNAEASNMFAQKHERDIHVLLEEHLEEINELNQSIIEKQMAGFEDIGNHAERKFRETIMELRIILKWFIAQAPENTVSSHEVILKKLEATTLKQMQETFFKAETTDQQKDILQSQMEDMIVHFKAQAGRELDTVDSADNLLMLTHEPNQPIDNAEIQSFIDFNGHYIKQLQKHWH